MKTLTASELLEKYNKAKKVYEERDQLIMLCREMYQMARSRKSTYLPADFSAWRQDTGVEYMYPSSKPQNAVDIAVSVLAGHPPQFKVSAPGQGDTDLTSRAEKFLSGVLKCNSRRQHVDLWRRLAFRTTLDGAAGIRITWDAQAPTPVITFQENPEQSGESQKPKPPWVIANYPRNELPISLDIIPWDHLYPIGGPTFRTPFSEIIQADSRNILSVLAEWGDIDGVDVSWLKEKLEDEHEDIHKERDYLEWWGYEDSGTGAVCYMCMYDSKILIPHKQIGYPRIPYVISTFKEGDPENAVWSHIPFLAPILYAVQSEEYLRSRILRIVDMLANMMPYTDSDQPVNISGTWGEILQLGEKGRIQFPQWPGNPPDIWKLLDEVNRIEGEGTFSSAMYGDVSSRMSGYGLSQLIGADTLRMDTPRANLELAISNTGDQIFELMQTFAYNQHLAVTMRSRGLSLSAMISGKETELLTIDAYVKPKQSSDEVRLATIGAQLAGLPNRPVSMAYILETYFGIAQPQDEQAQVMREDVIKDPIIRMLALIKHLRESDNEFTPIVEAQLVEAIQTMAKAKASPAPPTAPGTEQMGGGMAQGVFGNEPDTSAGQNVVEESGPSMETARMGGPV